MLACTALVGCSNEEDLLNGEQGVAGKAEKAYLAVDLNYAGIDSRATEGEEEAETPTFAAGSAAENDVYDITFFFFDASDNAYAVEGTNNYLVKPYEKNAEYTGDVNVEEISNPVLLIEESQNVPPRKIVAVLNSPVKKNMATLTALQDEFSQNTITVGEGDNAKTYFVMSNSVYKNAATGEAVVATEIPASSICASKDEALEAPVEIYVERVAAKVQYATNYGASDKFDTGITTAKGTAIYAKVTGWQVTNVKSKANLLKKIDTSWANEIYGFAWNDATHFRSYWASTTTTGDLTHPHSWNAIEGDNQTARYYYENTDEAQGKQSQLLVTATFVDEEGNDINDQIAEWYGAKYTLDDLKIQFANAVASQIFIKTGNTAVSITKDYITFEQKEKADTHRYLSYAKLAKSAPEGSVFVKADGKTEMSDNEVNEILDAIRPAKIWKEGGYYFLNIDHLGTAEGLVRNHLYNITVSNIDGLGTPVYDPKKIIIPETPENDSSSISAKINILSWKIVENNNVELK